MKIENTKKTQVKKILGGKRVKNTDKRDYGSVVIFAGKQGMAGASVLAAEAALRSGAGLVHVATPSENFPILQVAIPEAICIEEKKALKDLVKFNAIGFGPGMGWDKRTKELLGSILDGMLKSYDIGPLVIDADGLNVLSESKVLRNKVNKIGPDRIIITPHIKEAGRLLGLDFFASRNKEVIKGNGAPSIEISDREAICAALSEEYNVTAVLKGHGSLIHSNGEERCFKNPTGNPGMATAGSGDVLTGIITAFLGQEIEVVDAAMAGAYVHGLAGDIAKEDYGERSLLAGDIVNYLPYAFLDIEGK